MKFAASEFAALSLALLISPAAADTITYKNGNVYPVVITDETDRDVTIKLYGVEMVVPRANIKAIKKDSPNQNDALMNKWKAIDEVYQKEDREAEAIAQSQPPTPPTPEPPPPPEPPAEEEEELPHAIVFRAAPPPQAAPARNVAPGKEQQRLGWLQQSRQAIRKKKIIPGMTTKEVVKAWGWPFLTHSVGGVDTDTDRWTYQFEDEGRAYVFFKEGLVTSVVGP
ncbi:MAG: hypothetical protein NTZ78_07910 [Candidatus Aureabacteria bacterium]|nr:hypothetical protein [Candidatus Auribacterota bacterium]